MDERLVSALDFSNYMITLNNQKRILREQYQKWNARVASSDSATREQAEKMIHLIAEARKKYT